MPIKQDRSPAKNSNTFARLTRLRISTAYQRTLVRCDIALGPGVDTAFDDASPANLAALAALGRQLAAAEINNALSVLAPAAAA